LSQRKGGKARRPPRYAVGVMRTRYIGEHDGPDFYARLAADYDINEIGQSREEKPGCCGEEGWPSVGKTRGEKRAANEA
jgi:hypothetical protein